MTSIDYASRLDQLRALEGVDAVAILPGANMRYFTGLHFHLSQRPTIALVTHDGLALIVPQLELPKVTERPDLAVQPFVWADSEGYAGAFRAAIETLGLSGAVLGVDGMTMRVTEMFAFIQVDPSLGIVPVEREIIRIRARKTPQELELFRRAIAITETALATVMDWVRPGMTERQIAARLRTELLEGGGEGESFDTAVQTGPNSAFPHGDPGDRALQSGEFLLIDFGCRVGGYPADITRTFCFGEPTAEMQTIYDVVLRANEAARNLAGPGIRMGDVDRAARDVITAAGYGANFIHRTGHGLGLDIHEPIPQIAAGVSDVLEPGMTFTIEPGIYVPGLGGVRVEDDVTVTGAGLDVLTSYPRRLRVDA